MSELGKPEAQATKRDYVFRTGLVAVTVPIVGVVLLLVYVLSINSSTGAEIWILLFTYMLLGAPVFALIVVGLALIFASRFVKNDVFPVKSSDVREAFAGNQKYTNTCRKCGSVYDVKYKGVAPGLCKPCKEAGSSKSDT